MLWLIVGDSHQHADAAQALAGLPTRRERPRRRAAENRDEIATLQTIELHLLLQAGEAA